MTTLRDLRTTSDDAFRKGDAQTALTGYLALVKSVPRDLDVRLKIADLLAEVGNTKDATAIYSGLSTHAALSGFPLKSLVALKRLSEMNPAANQILSQIAALYGKGSARLGRTVRAAPADPNSEVPKEALLGLPGTLVALAREAAALAGDFSRGLVEPELLPPIPLWSELPSHAFASLLQPMHARTYAAGEALIREGEQGKEFFVIAAGSARVTKLVDGVDQTLAELFDGSIFGEMALVSDAPRAASVVATSEIEVLVFSRDALHMAAADAEPLRAALDHFSRERLLQNLLATSAFFRPLDPQQRVDLARRFTAHSFAPGTEIVHEGEMGKGLFVLLQGEVDISKIDRNDKVLLATLKPGALFGEISLVFDRPATATVTAASNTVVLFLNREYFTRLAAAVPQIKAYLESLADERILDTRLTLI